MSAWPRDKTAFIIWYNLLTITAMVSCVYRYLDMIQTNQLWQYCIIIGTSKSWFYFSLIYYH